jgi:hypothetical protein
MTSDAQEVFELGRRYAAARQRELHALSAFVKATEAMGIIASIRGQEGLYRTSALRGSALPCRWRSLFQHHC